jgi:pyridoxal biosynthesis lyase PdxS
LTSTGAGALYTGAEEYVPDERRVVVVDLRTVVRGAVDVLLSEFDAGAVATPARSAAVMLSSGVYGCACAAVERSEFKASSTFLSPPHAKAKSAAGRISIFLNI